MGVGLNCLKYLILQTYFSLSDMYISMGQNNEAVRNNALYEKYDMNFLETSLVLLRSYLKFSLKIMTQLNNRWPQKHQECFN